MASDDFFDILNTHLKQNLRDDAMEVGKITSLSPFTVKSGDLPLYEDDLYINKHLLEWSEIVTMENVSDNTSKTVAIYHPSKLTIGSEVLLYGLEWNDTGKTYQKYCLINIIN